MAKKLRVSSNQQSLSALVADSFRPEKCWMPLVCITHKKGKKGTYQNRKIGRSRSPASTCAKKDSNFFGSSPPPERTNLKNIFALLFTYRRASDVMVNEISNQHMRHVL